MSTKQLGPFRGLDARPGAADKPGGLLEGLNVLVNSEGALLRRPALTTRATLPADSKGIYAVGDQLRTTAGYNVSATTTTNGTNNQGATTLNVVSTSGFPASGFVTVISNQITPAASTLAVLALADQSTVQLASAAAFPETGTFIIVDGATSHAYSYANKDPDNRLTDISPHLRTGYSAGATVTQTGQQGNIREYQYESKTGASFVLQSTPVQVTLSSSLSAGESVRWDDCAQDNDLTPTIHVDYITDPTPLTLSDVIGTVIGSDGKAVSLVRYDDNSTALHRSPVMGQPPLSATAVAGLGFTPEFSLVRAAGRSFVLDGSLRYLRYSALDSNDADKLVDFTSNPDLSSGSGFLEVSQFASGVGSPEGLALFGGRIIVLYRSAVLIYRIDADQSRFFLEQQITGPGTSAPRSAVELGADTIFLSEAGVRVLSTVMQTLDAREDAIGGRIDHLAKQYAANDTITPIGHYARRLGCYLLAFGTDVLCLGILPGSAVLGWTRWKLPVAVDAWAEASGLLWMRSGNTLYAFEDSEDQDETSLGTFVDVPVLAETLPLRGTKLSIASAVSASGSEPISVQVVADGRPGVDTNGAPIGMPITLPPRSPEPARALVGKLGRTFSVRVYDAAARAGWRLDNLWLDIESVRN